MPRWIASFAVECPSCGCSISYSSEIGAGRQESRTTCASCGHDLIIVSDFPAPDLIPYAEEFQP